MSLKPISAVGFAEAVITHWPPFRWDEHQEASWTQAIVRELSGFEGLALANALAAMIRTRRDTKTPTVAICIDACLEARRFLALGEAKQKLDFNGLSTKPQSQMTWEERERLADDLVKCPVGRQAAQEGWIGSLHAYAVKFGRLPPAGEFGALKREAKETDRTIADVFRGEAPNAAGEVLPIDPAMRGVLVKFANDVLAKRKRLEGKVLGGAA